MPLASGTRLGPYEIGSQIGAGGMGEVYCATDTNLARHVAVKVLPDEVAWDTERLARFDREARTLAALNHPNIAQIYGLEKSGSTTALVMELVEGPTLADRIAQGPVPVPETLAIARQMAEALEAAHEQGIIHRDLKPANIKLRPDGTVKVLDFGLAKAMEPAGAVSPGLSHSPTITTPAMTLAGLILGTAAYMSPEQARGRRVDARADIWAFGVVLYEMLTGKRAFEADDVSLTLARVLEREVDLHALPTDVPARVRQVVTLCLRKDPRQRPQAIGDVRLAMDGAFETTAPAAVGADSRRSVWGRALPYAAIVALAVAVGVLLLRPEPVPGVVRFEIHPLPGETLPMGVPSPSPDGRMLVYVVTGADGVRRLHVRDLDSVETRVLPGTDGALYAFWAPDGHSLGFVTYPDRVLKRIDVRAGSPREVVRQINGPWHGDWSARGDIIHNGPQGLARVSADGGVATPTETISSGLGFPFFLSDGERFLVYDYDTNAIELASLGAAGRTTIVQDVDSAPLLAPTPRGRTYLLFMRSPDLMVQEFDEAAATVLGEPRVLVSDIGQVASPPVRPTVGVSPGGVLVYQAGGPRSVGRLQWVDRAGNTTQLFPEEAPFVDPRLSPDEATVAGVRTDSSGNDDLWTIDLARLSVSRRTFSDDRDRRGVWSPDGERLAFQRSGANQGVYMLDSNGREARLIEGNWAPRDWSPDGTHLLVENFEGLWMAAVEGDDEMAVVGTRNGSSSVGRFSPDGRYIAFQSDQSGRNEIYVVPAPPAAGRQEQVSIEGGISPRWSQSGELFFTAPSRAIMAVDVTTGDTFTAGIPRELFERSDLLSGQGYDVSRDGQRFLLPTAPEADSQDGTITVVLNWWAELEP